MHMHNWWCILHTHMWVIDGPSFTEGVEGFQSGAGWTIKCTPYVFDDVSPQWYLQKDCNQMIFTIIYQGTSK